MLTKKQKKVLDFINDYQKKKKYSPSLEEIRKKFKLASVSTVHFHIKRLEELGYINKQKNKPRAIKIYTEEKMVKIPVIGLVAAGQPIEGIEEQQETVAIAQNKLPGFSKVYALRVIGDSMVDENINNGDIVLVRQQTVAENGQKVVALIDNYDTTLKKFYKERGQIRLQPANKKMEPIIIKRDREFVIQGVVLDVIRNTTEPEIENFITKNDFKKYKKLPLNEIICGDAIREMQKLPDNSVDMTFADPPFNLDKKYGKYKDKKLDEDYIRWCNNWLTEMVRITKPTGSILVHNIPKWLIHLGHHLDKISYFKHWIAWDSMSVPLGKTLLPAHYGILFYTKEPKGFKFNELRAPHKRCPKCNSMIKDYGGKKSQIHPLGTLLSDVWTDIHRIRHRSRRDKHPCQLPEPLLERLILMTTDENDVVLDPFIGAGTTALAAKRLGRNFIGIDIDPIYKKVVEKKLKYVKYRLSNGYLYNGDHRHDSKYLKGLTISKKEGGYPIDRE